LQKAAPENGLLLNSIGSVSTKPSTSKPEIKETVIGPLKLSGSYPSLKNFLVALEKNSRIIEVENISFSVPKEGDLFDFGITIKVYSY
jgi:Tfp pilus assembly protein PilO